jgi:non-specific serine/threonine protein kinase/serine/threonine-protein kinase
MNEIAVVFRKEGRLDEAITRGEEALRLHQDALGRDHPLTLIAMNCLALAYSEAERFDDALTLFRDVLRLATGVLGPDHPDTLRDMVNLGAAYRDVGRPAKALPLFEDALERMKKVLDPDHPDALVCADHLAGTYLALGRLEKARAVLDRLVPARRKQLAADELGFARFLARFGRELIDAEQYHVAEELLRECLTIRKGLEPAAWTTFEAELLLGCSLLDRDQFAPAAERLVRGYEELKKQERTLPPRAKPLLPDAADRLVELYTEWRKPTEAAEWRAKRNQYPFVAPLPRAK